jgi:tetratricopeptide (TPR) repeat protein
MKSLRAVTVLVFLLVNAGAARLAVAEKTWIEVRSANFTVVSGVGERRGIEIAQRCEQLRAAFSILMDRATTNDPAPLLIFALNGEKEVGDLTGVADRNSKHSGLFLARADESFILIDASSDPWPAAIHEYTHELLNANISSNVQTWFDEGFAEYLSTFETRGEHADVGRVPVGELQFLRRNGKLLRLADLVRVNRNSETYNRNGPLQEMFYAQSWLLVHYLFDRQLIGRVQSFFDLMAAGIPLDDAVQKTFGMGSAKLEDELLAYAKGERFRFFSLPASREVPSANTTAKPLSDLTVSALKAEVRWHSKIVHSNDELAQLAGEFEFLLAHEPENSVALRGIGLALTEQKEYDSALAYLRKAVEADPQDARNHRALSVLLGAMEAAGSINLGAYSSYGEAEMCARLRPGFADAYRLMGFALMRQGDFDQAERMMRKALSLSPRSEAYELNLADIELKKHEYASALVLLQELKNSDSPEIARQAEYFLTSEVEKQ